MTRRIAEIALVVAAAALLSWGMSRAVARGEPAVKAWTSYAMVGLLVLCGVNAFIRSARVGSAVAVGCALFAALVFLAAMLGEPVGTQNRLPAILRALLFFVLIGVASVSQAISSRSLPGGR